MVFGEFLTAEPVVDRKRYNNAGQRGALELVTGTSGNEVAKLAKVATELTTTSTRTGGKAVPRTRRPGQTPTVTSDRSCRTVSLPPGRTTALAASTSISFSWYGPYRGNRSRRG